MVNFSQDRLYLPYPSLQRRGIELNCRRLSLPFVRGGQVG